MSEDDPIKAMAAMLLEAKARGELTPAQQYALEHLTKISTALAQLDRKYGHPPSSWLNDFAAKVKEPL